jgi:hypothetical protein
VPGKSEAAPSIAALTAEFVRLNQRRRTEPISEADERRWAELRMLLIEAQRGFEGGTP